MLHRKWCSIRNIFCLRKLAYNVPSTPIILEQYQQQRLVHTVKWTSFGRSWLTGGSELVPNFFFGRFRCWCCNIRPRAGHVALHYISAREWKCLDRKHRHTAYTQLIHALKWLCQLHWISHELAGSYTRSLLTCGCYDECNNAHAQYTTR